MVQQRDEVDDEGGSLETAKGARSDRHAGEVGAAERFENRRNGRICRDTRVLCCDYALAE
jgi:hypothetical protein